MHAQPTTFHFVRDYEVVKVEQEVPNEFLLVLDDGVTDIKDFAPDGEIMPSQPRAKGAYYKNIERKMLLKKKRVNVRIPALYPLCRTDDALVFLAFRRTSPTATSGMS